MPLEGELHLRKLRYFLAVAHHRSFARAARELLVAQPALSRAVKALEDDLGVALLERDSHRVDLTAAGRVLVDEGTVLLARAAAVRRKVAAAATGDATITVGFQPGLLISDVAQRFTRAHPGVVVVARRLGCAPDLRAEFADGMDVALARAIVVGDDVPAIALFDDPQLIAVPETHPLAARPSLTEADLDGETLLQQASAPRREPGVIAVTGLEEGLEVVALGLALARVPATAASYFRRPGVVYRPVVDAPPYPVVLALPDAPALRDEVAAFVALVAEHFAPQQRGDAVAA